MAQPELVCPLCSNHQFREEKGRIPVGGIGWHRLILMICTQCNYVLQFYKSHSVL